MFAAHQEGGRRLHPGLSLPLGTGTGATAPAARADRALRDRGGAGEFHRPVLRPTNPVRARSCSATRYADQRAAGERLQQGRRRMRDPRAAARRAVGIVEHAVRDARRGPGAPSGRDLHAGACRGREGAVRAGGHAAAGRGVSTTAASQARRRRRHDRGGARGLHEGQYKFDVEFVDLAPATTTR